MFNKTIIEKKYFINLCYLGQAVARLGERDGCGQQQRGRQRHRHGARQLRGGRGGGGARAEAGRHPVRGRSVLAAAAVAGPRAVQLLLRHELDHGGEVAVQVVHLVTTGVTNVGTLVELLNFDINTVMNAINYKKKHLYKLFQNKIGTHVTCPRRSDSFYDVF